MPGLLIMNTSAANGAMGPRDGENKKRSHDGKLVNGERNLQRRDAASNGQSNTPTLNGISMSAPPLTTPTVDQLAELPPEIIHITQEFYHPLSKLVLRIAQDCFNELQQVLQEMADMALGAHANGVLTNGMGSVPNPAINQQKKLHLLEFAKTQRAKFIKLLVLTEWGRKSSVDVCKLVDIASWAREQTTGIDAVDAQMWNIKVLLGHARHYNPDIRTALEVLSTGKASWIPDVGIVFS